MSSAFQTHLTNLERAVSLWPTATAFKIPAINESKVPQPPHILGYEIVTYTQLYEDVLRFAKYWAWRLQREGIPPRSVVGICLKGLCYVDLLHIYGISRAGYIPQCFSLFPSAVELVISLLKRSDARALIYQEGYFDPGSLKSSNSSNGVKLLPSLISKDGYLLDDSWVSEGSEFTLADMPNVAPEDTALIFHSTGTTSGMPKHVPFSYKYLDALVQKLKYAFIPTNPNVQDVNSWVGSICHMGQASYVMSGFYHGSCVIQQTTPFLSPTELRTMINVGGLNRASMFPALLVKLFRECQKRPESGLQELLSGLDCIVYGGGSMPKDELEWAQQHKINLINIYASTECGVPILQSRGLRYSDGEDYLRTVSVKKDDGSPLLSYRFDDLPADENGIQLKELVVLSDSGDCPDQSFRSPDGHFYTGDLFEEVKPGAFIYRGRHDDWIKMANACKCDARSVEDDVRKACADLVFDCVVIGSRRPSPALIVEPATLDMPEERLRQEIFQRVVNLRSHLQRLPHERIASPNGIIIVPPRSLIRTATKGNVRRNAVEQAMNSRLDTIFAI
ncbi:amp- ligase [Moniliophthora roreri MCA 2997]|uniref:Amp-ligase n=2 Tax=Moniliophthora roreri TaxID=221103 RepID=V2XIY5_MONRO|nr:amp- ligase [Moniliophthora roreri MCA 2997]KAI3607134.1 amp-ligase [Moniliophthora roreri]